LSNIETIGDTKQRFDIEVQKITEKFTASLDAAQKNYNEEKKSSKSIRRK